MLSRFQDNLNKPYYLFRPSQLLLRLKRKFLKKKLDSAQEKVVLPWGLAIYVRPSDLIGSAIFRSGIYDLCVSEVLWRLLDETETAIDAGANIGHMTSLMAIRVANKGQVLSFEPHPQVFQELSKNAVVWESETGVGQIKLHELGLSNGSGTANLLTTSEFASNRGTASLETIHVSDPKDSIAHPISIARLADIVDLDSRIGVMKIDVEGHELGLLQGASRLLADGRIRDIVFEDHNFYPSKVTDYLEKFGYTIFNIRQGALGVQVRPAKRDEEHYKYEAQSYLATLNAPRALKRLGSLGYQSLRAKREGGGSNTAIKVVVALFLFLIIYLIASKKNNREHPPED